MPKFLPTMINKVSLDLTHVLCEAYTSSSTTTTLTSCSRRCFLGYFPRVGAVHVDPHSSHGASIYFYQSHANKRVLARICRPCRTDARAHYHQHVGWPVSLGSTQLDFEAHHQGRTTVRYVLTMADTRALNLIGSRQ